MSSVLSISFIACPLTVSERKPPGRDTFHQNDSSPKCSSRILVPNSTRITPPVISARCLYRAPNQHPTATPATEMQKVVTPIRLTAERIGRFQKGEGHAYRQCVDAGGNGHEKKLFMVQSSSSSSVLRLVLLAGEGLRIMLPPISSSKIKATQWSYCWIYPENCEPSTHPRRGINA